MQNAQRSRLVFLSVFVFCLDAIIRANHQSVRIIFKIDCLDELQKNKVCVNIHIHMGQTEKIQRPTDTLRDRDWFRCRKCVLCDVWCCIVSCYICGMECCRYVFVWFRVRLSRLLAYLSAIVLLCKTQIWVCGMRSADGRVKYVRLIFSVYSERKSRF